MPVRFYPGPLAAAAQGFADGSEGFARNTLAVRQMKRQAEQDAEEKRRYEEEKARATDLYNRQVANDVFRKNLQGQQQAQNTAEFQQSQQGRAANTQSARDIAQMAVTSGLPEGAMGPHDPEHEQALGIARNLSPEALPFFLKEQEQIQRTKMLGELKERHLSQWQDMLRNPSLGQLQSKGVGSDSQPIPGHAEEIMARAQNAMQAISEATTPEQLQEALKTSKDGLEKTTTDIAKTLDKQNQLLRVIQHYRAGPHGIAEQQAALGAMPAGIREFAQKIVDDQDRLVSAFEAGAITSGQLTTLMERARNQKPGGDTTQSKAPPFDEIKTRQYLISLWKEQNPDVKNDQGHVIKQGNPVPSGWLDRETQRMRGIMGAGPEVPTPSNAPLGRDPDFEGFDSSKPDTSTPEGKKAALKAFLEHLGIDPNAPAPEKKKGGGKLLRSTGDAKLDDFYASSPH